MRLNFAASCMLAFLPLAVALPATAQRAPSPGNNFYLELLGNGGVYSLNYERRFTEQVSLRGGIGHWTAGDIWSDAETTITSVPLGIGFLPGSGTRRAEVGAGVVLGQRRWAASPGEGGRSTGFTSLTGVVGYRFQPAQTGWLFRAAFTPFFGLDDEGVAYPDRGFLPSIGISAGYSF